MRHKSFVYELWDGDECLYVGFSSNLPDRLREHIMNTVYADRVTDIRIAVYASSQEALSAEHDRIFELQPIWNTQSKGGRGIGAAAE